MRRVVLLGILTCAVAGCGHSASSTTSTAPAPVTQTVVTTVTTKPVDTTPAPAPVTLTLFFLRDGKVAAATRQVQGTKAVGAAALRELAMGPTGTETGAGLTSAVPANADFQLSISQGTAVVVGPEGLTDPASAQIVYTLTQFPTVKTVRINGGNAGDRGQWEPLTPPILVLTPTPGQTVSSPLRVAGTANTFEATLQLELQDANGKVLATKTVTATSGSGTRGTFEAELPFTAPAGAGKLVAYESSAENGKPIHVVAIPLMFGP